MASRSASTRRAGRVTLADLWPATDEVEAALVHAGDAASFTQTYGSGYSGGERWDRLEAPRGAHFPWAEDSTYLRRPPFFDEEVLVRAAWPASVDHARVLGLYGDSFTTDHVTPSGEIPEDGEAGRYLASLGVARADFNATTQRRGNHDVMARVTFANARAANQLVPDRPGGWTLLLPEGEPATIYEASQAYRDREVTPIVLAGRDYGMGSSRDWAAKGPALLGVRAVIAQSFERIHRANLIALGIAPLLFAPGEGWRELGLDGRERFRLGELRRAVEEGTHVEVTAEGATRTTRFDARPDLRDPRERALLAGGGIFPAMLATARRQAKDCIKGRTEQDEQAASAVFTSRRAVR